MLRGATKQKYMPFILSLLCLILCSGCSSSFKPRAVTPPSANKMGITEQEALDIDPYKEITEEDIQQAIEAANKAPLGIEKHANIILVQSGSIVPDSVMQHSMSEHYQISVYSGISPNKNIIRKKDQPRTPKPNYIKSVRLAAAKSRQSKIVIYWGALELGTPNKELNTIKWQVYHSGSIDNKAKIMRYLLRFAVVDVKTGNWVMYSPSNIEQEITSSSSYYNDESIMEQINNLKNDAYKKAVLNFVSRFKT